jgi:hypothetical protein
MAALFDTSGGPDVISSSIKIARAFKYHGPSNASVLSAQLTVQNTRRHTHLTADESFFDTGYPDLLLCNR